jgi:hypothetical protein
VTARGRRTSVTARGRRTSVTAPGERPAARPVTADVAAAILVFGGLFGLSQLAVGDVLVTGSLPAKGPILGVATILYLASTFLGFAAHWGRAWFPALNLAVAFALLYALGYGRLSNVVLALVYAVAAAGLLRARWWFGPIRRGWRPDSRPR